MKRACALATVLLACSSTPVPNNSTPPSSAMPLPQRETAPAPEVAEGPPSLDPKLVTPPYYLPPRDPSRTTTAERTRLRGTSGKQRLSIIAKPLGKPTTEGLQWLRINVDAHGSSARLLTEVTIAVDATGGHDSARAALTQAAARKLVKGLGRMARVTMVSLSTEPTGHPENPMTSGNRGRMLAAIEHAGAQEQPAAVGPALADIAGPNVVIVAAARSWADDDDGLARVAERLETLGLRVQLLLIGRDVDAGPFTAVEQVHRASSTGQIDAAVRRIIRDIPRTHFLGARLSLTFPEGMRVLGGRQGTASEDNRTVGFLLGDLWAGFRHEADVLVELDPKLPRNQTLNAKIQYSYRNPEPGTSILRGSKTTKVRLSLP